MRRTAISTAAVWLVAALAMFACSSTDATPTAGPNTATAPDTATPEPPPTSVAPPVVTATQRHPTLDPTGRPEGSNGPLLVYTQTPGRTELVVRDLESDEELYRFPIPTDSRVHMAGNRLVLRTFGARTTALWSIALDGSDRVDLWRPDSALMLENVVVSPHGDLVAINAACDTEAKCTAFELPNVIEVIEVATGIRRLEIEQTADLPTDFYGIAGPIAWPGPAQIALGGHFHRDGGGGDAAVLGLDGSIDVIRVAPDRGLGNAWNRARGRPVPEFVGDAFCSLGGAQGLSRVALTDPVTGDELNALEADAPVLNFFGFGDGGWDRHQSEVLVQELLADHATRAQWRSEVAEGDCPGSLDTDWDAFPVAWWILSTNGEPPIRIASEIEARLRWESTRLATYACGGLEVLDTSIFRREEGPCAARTALIDIRLSGDSIVEAPGPQVIGVVDLEEGTPP